MKVAGVAALLLALMLVLAVDGDPDVPVRGRPSAQDIRAAREVWTQLKIAQRTGSPTRVRVDDDTLVGLSGLLSDAVGVERIRARLTGGELAAGASFPLPLGFWLNAQARIDGEHDGFPAYRLKVGQIALPAFASRWIAEIGRSGLRLAGARIPPLDQLVRHVEVQERQALAEITLPPGTGMFDRVLAMGLDDTDDRMVGDLYCQLAAEQSSDPGATLPVLLNKAFATPSPDGAKHSRASFLAIGLLVVGERAEPLAPEAAKLARNCPHAPGPIYLHGREDLAKHWAFSAALTAAVGDSVAANLGEWKELDDSLPDGSGFSFVDLAADRSGMRMALRAMDSRTSAETMRELRLARDEDLLPLALLRAPEGLSEGSFLNRFGSLEEERYRTAVAHIDRVLRGD